MAVNQNKPLNEETVIAAPKAAAIAKKNAKKQDMTWKSVMIGGVSGIALGAGSALAVDALATPAETDEADINIDTDSAIPTECEAPVAKGVTDAMSFADAFATARAEVGAGGVFEWHGQVYGTFYETEWNAMSEADRHDYFATVIGTHHDDGGASALASNAGASGYDAMSFADAFAAARAELGAGGVFEWHGQSYGTFYENEWDAMSQEERNDYYASVNNGSAPHSSGAGAYAYSGGAHAGASGLDSMSFADAFAAARAELGAGGVFEWHGHTYNTFYENEWNNMSPQDQSNFMASVNGGHGADEVVLEADDSYQDGIYQDGPGPEYSMDQPEQSGQDYYDQGENFSQEMPDDGPDMPEDTYFSDNNLDNNLDNNDVYSGMPDYTNDADTSSFA